jgi:hypothetical protein
LGLSQQADFGGVFFAALIEQQVDKGLDKGGGEGASFIRHVTD